MMNTRLFMLIVLLLPGSICAGKGIFDMEYTLVHYGKEEGLPVESLKNLEWDEATGNLWIGTEGGLVNWNGTRFVTNDRLGRIFQLARHPRGGIYVVSEFFDVYHARNTILQWVRSERKYYQSIEVNGKRVSKLQRALGYFAAIQQMSDKSLLPDNFLPLDAAWNKGLLSTSGTVFEKDGLKATLLCDSILFVGRFIKDSSGNVLGSDLKDIYQYTQGRLVKKVYTGLPKGATGPRQWILDNNLGYPSLLYDGQIWIADRNNHLQPLKTAARLPEHVMVQALRRLGQSSLFAVATSTKALFVLRPSVVEMRYPMAGVKRAHAITYAQAEVAPGTVLTSDGAVGNLPRALQHAVPVTYTLFQEPGKALWYSGAKLIRCDVQTGTLKQFPINDGFSSVIAVVDGQSLVVTASRIYRLRDTLQPELLFSSPTPFGRRSEDWGSGMSAAVQYGKGNLAFAVGRDLFQFDIASRKLRRTGVTQKCKIRAMSAMDGYLLMGTYGEGIWCCKDGIVRPLPLDKTNSLRYAHCFMRDTMDGVWISSNDGLFRVGLSSLKAAFANRDQQVYYHHLGNEDGIVNTEFNGGCMPCALQLSNGALSFPSMEGLVWVWPDTATLQVPSGIILPRFIAAGQDVTNGGEQVVLSAEMRGRLTVEIGVSSFSGARNVYAWYRMAGYDDRWYPVPETNPVVYNALLPGDYTMEIKALNGFGPQDFVMRSFPVSVRPPWYRTTVAYLAAYVLVGAFLYLLYRRRLKVVRRRARLERLVLEEQLKTIRAQVNPHFLKDSFAFISQSLGDGSSDMTQDLIFKLSAYLRSVLDSSYEQVMSLEEELEIVEAYMSIQVTLSGDALHFDLDLDDEVDVFGIDVPAMFLQPLMEHALRYGQQTDKGGDVQLHIYNDGAEVLFDIRITIDAAGILGLPVVPSGSIPAGLEVTERRLRMLYKTPDATPVITWKVEQEAYLLTVRIPNE